MIELAARKHPGLRFRVHDLMQGPLEERFDYTVAADVAEHVPDLDKMMSSLAGMLTDAGGRGRGDREPAVVSGPARRRAPRSEDAGGRPRVALAGGPDLGGPPGRAAGALVRPFAGDAEGGARARALDSAPWAAGLRQRMGLIQRAVFELAGG